MASPAEITRKLCERKRQGAGRSPVAELALGTADRQAAWEKLAGEVQRLEGAGRHAGLGEILSTGCSCMDACLPAGGYTPGSIIEYLRSTEGCGASYLAMAAAAAALRKAEDKYLVVVDPERQFYPPALLGYQIDLQRVVWVHPRSTTDAIWAMDQALRTQSVAAVIGDIDMLDDRNSRRLQLAAQRGGGLGLLLRGLSARRSPSWADVQWVVRSLVPQLAVEKNSVGHSQWAASGNFAIQSGESRATMRRLELVLARLRGGKAGMRLMLDIDPVNGHMHAVSTDKSPKVLSPLLDETAVKTQAASQRIATEVIESPLKKRQVKAS
jgi:protein ImuA